MARIIIKNGQKNSFLTLYLAQQVNFNLQLYQIELKLEYAEKLLSRNYVINLFLEKKKLFDISLWYLDEAILLVVGSCLVRKFP